MRLSKLEILGFKSFAQKIEIAFGQGIIAIVGPNGCGKTNVVDAIRWVLGEQRPGALRSGRMEDVIFAGSPTRHPLGMAEVSLTIDDVQTTIPVEFSEVTITRRLFRSGESDYLLNKIPCRLADINNLFMDTGVGPHAYSVIEQGMIDTIISDRVEDRRRLFEEAAGVTKYKVRRKMAWSKLTSVQQDLVRINDLIGEVERQVSALRRQAGRVARYKAYAEELQRLEVALGSLRYIQLVQEANPIEEDIERRNIAIAQRSARVSEREATVVQIRVDVLEREQRLTSLGTALSQLTARIHEKDRAILTGRERLASLEGQIQRMVNDQEEMANRLLSSQQQQESTQREEASLAERVERSGVTIKEKEGGFAIIEREVQEKRKFLERQRSQIIEILRRHAEQSRLIERAEVEMEGVKERIQRLSDEDRKLAVRCDIARKQMEMTEADSTVVIAEMTSGEKQYEAVRQAIHQAEDKLEDCRHRQGDLLQAVSATQAQLSLWEKIVEGYEGYSQGVKTLMLNSPYRHRLTGALADVISTDDQYAKAIEAALEGSLETVMTDEVGTATEAIRFLKDGRHGRVRFLPVDRLRNGNGTSKFFEGEGVIGYASDLLRCEERYVPAVCSLLHGTLVVRDLETALTLATTTEEEWSRFVTLDGEVLDSSGCLIGGERGEGGDGLVGRKQHIDLLKGGLEEQTRECERVESEVREDERHLTHLSSEKVDMERTIQSLRDRRIRLHQEMVAGKAEIERVEEQRANGLNERHRLEERIGTLDTLLCEGRESAKRIEMERVGIEAELQRREGDLQQAENRRSKSLRELEQLRIDMASLRERHDGLRHEMSRLRAAVTNSQERIVSRTREIADARASVETIQRQKSIDEVEIEKLYQEQSALERQRTDETTLHQDLLARLREIDDDVRALRRSQEEEQRVVHQLTLRNTELMSKAEALRERMREDYRLDLATLPPPEGAGSPDLLEKRIQETREHMRVMGPVNLAAAEEYETQRERYEFLTKERDDLIEAEEHLKETIAKIDRTARKRLTETFEHIREHFKRMFVEFFDGGEADVLLGTGDDPMEVDIQVVARPRGKRLQHIHLLSGGERALTAIALLFALYLIKPSPFCILDEVDAPLDDENLNRFLKVVRRFSQNTQFLTVTHNKRTMQAADVLCGITMEEVGVSKVVAVRVGE